MKGLEGKQVPFCFLPPYVSKEFLMNARPEKKRRILTFFCVYWLIYFGIFVGLWVWTSNFRPMSSLLCSADGKYALAWTRSEPFGQTLNL